jgi:hypothetical protein
LLRHSPDELFKVVDTEEEIMKEIDKKQILLA